MAVIDLPVDPSSPARARLFVCEQLARRCPPEVVDSAALLVSELVTNAVLHAGTPMRVNVSMLRDGARVEVEDGSHEMPEPREPNTAEQRGRGLLLVDRVARSWGVHQTLDGKAIWFEIGGLSPRENERGSIALARADR